MDETLAYYNTHAAQFSEDTLYADMSMVRASFLEGIPKEGLILDLGCGSGRDSKAFLQAGYRVEAMDGAEALCKTASTFLQCPVMHKRFDELEDVGKYDGIWACASLLHVPSEEISSIMQKISTALKSNGIFYMSVKKGEFEGFRNGRYFTDYTENDLEKLLIKYPFHKIRIFESRDVRPGRSEEIWLNALARKRGK